MEKPNIIDYRNTKNIKIKRRWIIPFMKGRPVRQTIINSDDITNLIIMLNTCKTLNEFAEKM